MSVKAKYANNPQTFMNSYLSAIRNSIISLSLGIGVYGFSKTFKKKSSENIMRLISLFLYLYSITLCINSNLMLRQYLQIYQEDSKNPVPEYIDFRYWKVYETSGWILTVLLGILIILAMKRFVLKLF